MDTREEQLKNLDDIFLEISKKLDDLHQDIMKNKYEKALTNSFSEEYIIRWIDTIRDEIRIVRQATLYSWADSRSPNPGKIKFENNEINEEFLYKVRENINKILNKWFPKEK